MDGVGVWSLGSLRSAAAPHRIPWAPEVTAAWAGPGWQLSRGLPGAVTQVGAQGTMPPAFRPGHSRRSLPSEAPGLRARRAAPASTPSPSACPGSETAPI